MTRQHDEKAPTYTHTPHLEKQPMALVAPLANGRFKPQTLLKIDRATSVISLEVSAEQFSCPLVSKNTLLPVPRRL